MLLASVCKWRITAISLHIWNYLLSSDDAIACWWLWWCIAYNNQPCCSLTQLFSSFHIGNPTRIQIANTRKHLQKIPIRITIGKLCHYISFVKRFILPLSDPFSLATHTYSIATHHHTYSHKLKLTEDRFRSLTLAYVVFSPFLLISEVPQESDCILPNQHTSPVNKRKGFSG